MNLQRLNQAIALALVAGAVFLSASARAATTNVTLLPHTNPSRFNQDGLSLGTASAFYRVRVD